MRVGLGSATSDAAGHDEAHHVGGVAFDRHDPIGRDEDEVARDVIGLREVDGHVAVYLPQSYNIAGNLVLVPADRVVTIEGDSSDVMSFIVSGGVTGGGSQTDAHPATLVR